MEQSLISAAERLDTYYRGGHHVDRTGDQHAALGTAARAIHAVLLVFEESGLDLYISKQNQQLYDQNVLGFINSVLFESL